jgi:voltage-gated sodium channel
MIQENLYSKSKFIQTMYKISNAKWFSNLTVVIIIVYAATLGFKTMDEAKETEYGSFIFFMDYAVTIYFLLEIFIRISAYEKKMEFFKNEWNVFDFVIVVLTTLPIEQTDFAAVARIMRVFRILRLFTARPELKRIIDMLINAIPSIIDIVLLMFIIFYIYAIIGSFMFADLKSGLFDNFLTAMLTLFRILTFEDWTDVMYEAMELHQWAWIYFVSFVIIAGFVFFNLFIAVIIGEMQDMRETDKQKESKKKDEITKLKQEIQELKELNKAIFKLIESKYR